MSTTKHTAKKIGSSGWIYRGASIRRMTPLRGRAAIYVAAVRNETERVFSLAQAKAWIDSNLDGSAVAR